MIDPPRLGSAYWIASALAAILLPAAGKAEDSPLQRDWPVKAVVAQMSGVAE